MGEEEYQPREKDAFYATLTRTDVDRLRALRRIASGVTRCPECDARNPAGNRFCQECGAKLYPVEEENDSFFDKEDQTEDRQDR